MDPATAWASDETWASDTAWTLVVRGATDISIDHGYSRARSPDMGLRR